MPRRPDALMRGPRRKPTSLPRSGGRTLETAIKAASPGQRVPRHPLQPAMHEDTVLADQRNQIRECRQGHNVEIILEINAWIGRLLEQGDGRA